MILLPLLFSVLVILARHATLGFAFDKVNKVMWPFQRNHVSYAATLSIFFPFIYFSRFWYNKGSSKRWFLNGVTLFMLGAIYLTFTRAAYIALVIAAGAYFVIRLRLVKYILILATIAAIGLVAFLVTDNKYLDYAPNYDTTIAHKRFDNLIEATAKMEDISTMERLYRWVAGVRMSTEHPMTGFGPGNFYNFYRSYTVTGFQTYVSDNPEKSGIHSYYLMVLVEQGFPGVVFFLLFSFFVLIRGEHIYHQSPTQERKRMVMTLLLSLVIIYSFLIINDLIETDKAGSFFFLCIAVLINFDLKNKRASAKVPEKVKS